MGEMSGFAGTPKGHLGGKFVQKLEAEFRAYFGVNHAVACNSATSALYMALVACGVSSGDKVVVTPYSFSASASCVLMAGAKPVFVDINPDTFNMSPLLPLGEEAIIPVHLMGHPCTIMSTSPKVIEDASQSIGATYKNKLVGTIGDCGVFSFNQSKHVSSGEGGMLITNNDDIARIARAVRNHGEVSDPELGIVGYNYRLTEIQAAIALEQFKNLDKMNAYRIELANYMTDKLSKIDGLTPPYVAPDCTHVYYTYAVKFDKEKFGMHRDEFQEKMLKRGFYFGRGYVKPLHLLPIFGGQEGQYPIAERMWKDELLVFDWLRYPCTKDDVDEAVKTVREVLVL